MAIDVKVIHCFADKKQSAYLEMLGLKSDFRYFEDYVAWGGSIITCHLMKSFIFIMHT